MCDLYGSPIFGAVGKFEVLPAQPPLNTRAMVFKLQRLVRTDSSGLDALEHLRHTLQRTGMLLVPASVNEYPLPLIRRPASSRRRGRERRANSDGGVRGRKQAG